MPPWMTWLPVCREAVLLGCRAGRPAVRALGRGELERLKGAIECDERVQWTTLAISPDARSVVVGVASDVEVDKVRSIYKAFPVSVVVRVPKLLRPGAPESQSGHGFDQ